MRIEIISERDDLVIRRLILEPGEPMFWHTDICHRFSVVIRGERLRIEYRDTDERNEFDVAPGEAGWDAPEPRVHRAVNIGPGPFEEVVTFYRAARDVDPQPSAEGFTGQAPTN